MELRNYELAHGVTLSCRVSGAPGRPLLVFLHGFPEGAFVWDGMLEHFSHPDNGAYRCVAPNLRGYERSSAPSEVTAYRAKHLVQDIAALLDTEGGSAAALIAHDWGGAVAWSLANQQPHRLDRLVIVNSPHPGTFWRELVHNPQQQQASAYMNFLIRPDAEVLLMEDDYRRLWEFFTAMGASDGPYAWLTDAVREQYRALWHHGLSGGCNYYRASPLRPPRPDDPAAAAVTLPHAMLTVEVPTWVLWGLRDIALPPALLDGLSAFVPRLTVQTVPDASHWIVHEQPTLVRTFIAASLDSPNP